MYAAKSTACFCIISTVVLRGAVLVFFFWGGEGVGMILTWKGNKLG